jgi:hypothetical protein
VLSAEVEAMARELAGDASAELVELARGIAEAEIDVMRIRRVRNDLLGRALSNLGNRIPQLTRDMIATRLDRSDDHERRGAPQRGAAREIERRRYRWLRSTKIGRLSNFLHLFFLSLSP